jgi:hypothetical protein
MMQLVVAALALTIGGKNVWKDFLVSDYFSSGALLFYSLIGAVIVSFIWAAHYSRHRVGDETAAERKPAPPRLLFIKSASYGLGNDAYADVTVLLKGYVKHNCVNVPVSNSTFNMDPFPGKPKHLRVYYLLDGVEHEIVRHEGDQLVLPDEVLGPGKLAEELENGRIRADLRRIRAERDRLRSELQRECSKNEKPEIRAEIRLVRSQGIHSQGHVRGVEHFSFGIYADLYVCNFRATKTTLRTIEMDGSAIRPPIQFSEIHVFNPTQPRYHEAGTPAPPPVVLEQGIEHHFELTAQANVEGQRENFPTISLHGLKILVVDAFGGKHVASLQPDAAVTPIPTR